MMNPTKFVSPKLDTPSSRYKFLKFAFKSVKINQEKHFKYWLTTGTRGSTGPTCEWHTKLGRGMTGEKLIDGKVIGDEVGTNVLPILFRIYRYPRFARRITGASSPASMVAHWRCAVVLWPSPGNGMARWAWLQHLQTLAKLYGVD